MFVALPERTNGLVIPAPLRGQARRGPMVQTSPDEDQDGVAMVAVVFERHVRVDRDGDGKLTSTP